MLLGANHIIDIEFPLSLFAENIIEAKKRYLKFMEKEEVGEKENWYARFNEVRTERVKGKEETIKISVNEVIYLSIRDKMLQTLHEMEQIAQLFKIEPFSIYFLGGSACILGRYTERATKDYDFIDLGYNAKLGKVFVHLRDYDILEYESTILSPNYKERAIRLTQFKYLKIYVLSKEDIIVSKIIRMAEKDIEDIEILMENSDRKIILQIIDEVMGRKDLFSGKRKAFLENLPKFKERFYV